MKILVIGAGGVGWPLATGLAQGLPLGAELVVADDDVMEGSGAARLPKGHVSTFGRQSDFAGRPKVDALASFIHYVGQQATLTTWAERIEPKQNRSMQDFDLVVDCTDASPDWRNALKAACSEGTYLRVSYDIAGGRIFAIVSESVPFSLDMTTGGYQQAPSFNHAMLAGALGAEVILRRLGGWDIQLPVRVEIPYRVKTIAEHVTAALAEVGITDVAVSGEDIPYLPHSHQDMGVFNLEPAEEPEPDIQF
jgi:hypothetical protein